VGHGDIDCSKTKTTFRSADGTCNDVSKPFAGAARVAFGRNVPPQFIDQKAAEKLMIPNPADVSKEFFTRDEFKPVPFLNMLAAVWIQFMNHDWLTHGKNEERDPHRVKSAGGEKLVDRTKENDQPRSQYKPGFGKTTTNDVTHWWDASQIYGSDQETRDKLRFGRKGLMRMAKINGREVLPKDAQFNAAGNVQNKGYEETGFRDNWWMGLSMLHTLFVKEHNAIAAELFRKHVTTVAPNKYVWTNTYKDKKSGKMVTDRRQMDEGQLDEQIFEVARLINAAVLAKIHTVEWTPAILPNPVLKKAMYTNWYGLANPQSWSRFIKHIPGFNKTDWFADTASGYVIGGIVGDKVDNFGVPFSITEEFTSVYRLHSLLPENLEIRKLADKKPRPIAFADTRNEKSYAIMANNDLKDLYYSFGVQLPGQLVLNNFPKFMQNLEIPGRPNMDLGMVDIIRDRERGVPRYNQFRRALNPQREKDGIQPIRTYRDFFPAGKPLDAKQQEILKKFYKVYGKDSKGNDNVEQIDL
ncbi:MAG: peroxidase family protein, partial [Bdellovibrionota bacterium]